MSAYSDLKIVHHEDKLSALRWGEQIIPAQVQLIISDLCNQDCGFCAYRWSGYASNQLFTQGAELAVFGHDNPKRWIPYEKVVEILEDCSDMGVRAIQITGGGEPTVHPQYKKIFKDVLERRLDLALVTNGARLDDESLDILTQATWIRVSVDCGTAETYAQIRRVSPTGWTKVWENIRKLVTKKEQTGSDLVIGIGFVVTADNYKEIVQGTKIARDAGVDNIRLSAVFQPDDENYFKDFYEEAASNCRAAETLATKSFQIVNNFGDRVSDLKQHSPDYSFCGYQQFVTYIGGDLNVYRCCVLAYNERGIIGSIKNQSFKELWKSEQKRIDFENFDARQCNRCMFNSKNKVILYALDPKPLHVNFV